MYRSVTDEFPDGTNPISEPNSAWMCGLQLKLWPFLWFLAYFGQNLVPWQRPLDPCNQKCLIWIGWPLKPYPRTKNFVNSCYTSEVMSIRRFATSLALRELGNFRYFCNKCGKLFLKINLTPKRTYLAWKHILWAINNVPTIYSATCAGEQEHKKIYKDRKKK